MKRIFALGLAAIIALSGYAYTHGSSEAASYGFFWSQHQTNHQVGGSVTLNQSSSVTNVNSN